MKIHISYNNQQSYESVLIFLNVFCDLKCEDYEILPTIVKSFYIEEEKKNVKSILIPVLKPELVYECVYKNVKMKIREYRSKENYVLFRSKILSSNRELEIEFDTEDKEYVDYFFNKVKQCYLNDFKHIKSEYISHYIFNDFREWEKSDNYIKRGLSTLYLPKQSKESLFDDVENFYNNADICNFYKMMNIPQTRIYLFYGYPGTGKTTTSFVIASKLNLNICTLDFTNKIDDTVFRKCVKDLPDDSLLLLEDIDHLFCPKKEHDEARHSITFSGLLNIIDGISKVRKLICVITCNNIKALDKTLLRRFDYSIHFEKFITQDQLESFCNQLPENIPIDRNKFVNFFKSKKTTMNIIQKWVLMHIYNLIMKKYSLTEKLEEFNTFNSWYDMNDQKDIYI